MQNSLTDLEHPNTLRRTHFIIFIFVLLIYLHNAVGVWLTLLAGIMSIMHKQEMDSVGIQLSGGNLNNFLTLCCRSFVYYSQDTNTFH